MMEEIFKGLVERAQYYEQFESFRSKDFSENFSKDLSGQFENILIMDLKMKASTIGM
jgi:hypothetical protein